MKSLLVERLKYQAESEGYTPGTQEFEDRLVMLKVAKCQDLRGFPCAACPHQDFCSMYEALNNVRRKK